MNLEIESFEDILNNFDQEYKKSKLEHIEFFLTESKVSELSCSTSGSADSGCTNLALEKCHQAYRMRRCASASVIRLASLSSYHRYQLSSLSIIIFIRLSSLASLSISIVIS